MHDRITELLEKKKEHQHKVTELNNWLLNNFYHSDRSKVFSDKAWHECEMNRIDTKVRFLRQGHPENGFSADVEQNNLNQNIITRITT